MANTFHTSQKVKVDQFDTYEDDPDEGLNDKDENEGTILIKSKPDTFHTLHQVKVDDTATNKGIRHDNDVHDTPIDKKKRIQNFYTQKSGYSPSDVIENYNDNHKEKSFGKDTYQDNSGMSRLLNVPKSRKPKRVVRVSSKADGKENISDLDEDISFTLISNDYGSKLFDGQTMEKESESGDEDVNVTIEVEKDVSDVDEKAQNEIKRDIPNSFDRHNSEKEIVNDAGSENNQSHHRNMTLPSEPDLYFHGRYKLLKLFFHLS